MVLDTETDGGTASPMSQDEQYAVVYAAVTDALYDVLGTIALLGFALLFVYLGARGLVEGFAEAGVLFLVFGLVVAAWALDIVPTVRD
ncbi:hypothetical protein [Natronobacterium texcoconense]|uniref:Uncharacterized protein n=1 Tax=Natronobacterium texcoconense TaxID=1095778 RepID=A0A1H1CRP9_NATTX|nr:hypothetical protein [Natronobacterium texcoconense]SDQ66987.1 hypothetical protein SAMN04489842_1506 [Natronobacterium texcoconense]